jgi:hypothetical protein
VSELGAGDGGNVLIFRDIQSSESTFVEFSGWGSGLWGGRPVETVSTMLTALITDAITVITVVATSDFGSTTDTGTMLIDSELIDYTIFSTVSFIPCVRGQHGTTAVIHADEATVYFVDQYWTGWGNPVVPRPGAEGTALNTWSVDTFGEDMVAAKDTGKPYYWNTPLKMSGGSPYMTNFLSTSAASGYASGIVLSDAVPMSSMGFPTDPGHGQTPESVGFLMTSPRTRQVIAFGATDTLDNYDPMLVRWCSIDAPGSWGVVPGNYAGGNPLQNGSKIISAARSDNEIIVWTDKALYSMKAIADGDFAMPEISDSVSIVSRNAHKVAGGVIYWMGDNNFYSYSSVGGISNLACTVLVKVFDELNYAKRETITCALNSLFNEIIWFYPSDESLEPDKYVIFNYMDQVWAYGGSMPRTGWSDAGIREHPNAAYSRGEYTTGAYQGIDRSIVYDQESGYRRDLDKMDSWIETGYFDMESGSVSMFIDKIVPDYRGLDDTNPRLSISVSAKNYPFSTDSITKSVKTTLSTEYSNLRLRGRTISMKFDDFLNDDINSGWQLGDPRISMKPDGER